MQIKLTWLEDMIRFLIDIDKIYQGLGKQHVIVADKVDLAGALTQV